MATTVSVSSIRCSLFSLNTNTLQPSLSNNISFSKKTHFSSVRRTKITHTSVITGVSAQPHSVISCLESKLSESVIKEAGIDIQLPRRSLMVKFTCNSCGQRTERMVNRLAYERGTVFVQCAGCLKHHKLVDNLGLVVEYDLRDTELNAVEE